MHQHLEAFEQKCKDNELAWQTEVIIGEPVEEIALSSPKADIMIMGEMLSVSGAVNTERKNYLRNVLHRATRPVLIARDGHARLYHLSLATTAVIKQDTRCNWAMIWRSVLEPH